METSNENKSADSIPTKKESPPVAPLIVGKIDMSPIKLKNKTQPASHSQSMLPNQPNNETSPSAGRENVDEYSDDNLGVDEFESQPNTDE